MKKFGMSYDDISLKLTSVLKSEEATKAMTDEFEKSLRECKDPVAAAISLQSKLLVPVIARAIEENNKVISEQLSELLESRNQK